MATSDAEDEWMNLLKGHPIFSPPKSLEKSVLEEQSILQLSTSSLPKFTSSDPEDDSLAPSGRRQVMILKDADIIVAAGKEIRMSSIGDLKLSRSVRKSYKVCHTLYNDRQDSRHRFRPCTHRTSSSRSIKYR